MNKKAIIALLIIIAMIGTVSAGTIFDDKVKDNEPFYIGGVKHVAKYYPSAEKMSLAVGEERLLIKKEDCEILNQVQYCLDSTDESYDEETGNPISVSHIRIVEFGPDINVDIEVSEEKPLIDEDVEVTVTLENTGTERATNVNYEDRYPAEIYLQGSAVNKALNMISWTGNLEAGKSQTITYKIKFKDFITYTSKPTLQYVHNSKVKTKTVEETEFEVQRPYKAGVSLSARSVALNTEIEYVLSIDNKGEELMSVDADIDLPSGTQIISRERDFVGIPPNMRYEGSVKGGENKTASFKYRVTKKGEYNAKTMLKVDNSKYHFDEVIENDFSVGISDIIAIVNLTPNPVKAGSEFMAEVKVKNRGEDTINIAEINFGGNYSEFRGWRNIDLEPGKSYYAMNKLVYAPIVYEDITYSFKISGKYTKGDTFEFSEEGILQVLPFEKVVDFDEKYFVVNESNEYKYLNMTVTVENVKDYELTKITAIDGLPKGYKMILGSRDYDGESLTPGEKVSYSYILRMPVEDEEFEIVHTFNAEPDVIFEMPVDIDLSPDVSADEESESGLVQAPVVNKSAESEEVVEEEVQEEKGFFSKVWNWLFGWL